MLLKIHDKANYAYDEKICLKTISDESSLNCQDFWTTVQYSSRFLLQ